jgi:hypothetical protein
MTSPTQFDGGIDETDRDQTEAELATAIAALLAAKAATAPWLDLVRGSLSGIITNYLRRCSYDMAVAAGLSSSEAAAAADDATQSVLGDVERHTAEWLKISADDHAEKARQTATEEVPPPKEGAPVQKPGQPMTKPDAETAGNLIATSLATYARERVRGTIAKKLGARFKTWQCVVPETEVRGLVSAVSRRPYVGSLVSFHTRSSRRLPSARELDGDLTVTPNHLVLTNNGWVRADQVQVGDYLVRCRFDQLAAGRDPDIEDAPPSIIEIFHTANESRPAERMMRSVMDFDSEGPNSYVDVVATNSKLRDRLQPPLAKPSQHFLFTLPDEALPCFLFALGLRGQGIFRWWTTAKLSGPPLVNSPLDGRIGVGNSVESGRRLIADRDASVKEYPGYGRRRDSMTLPNCCGGHPACVVSEHSFTEAVAASLPLGHAERLSLSALPLSFGVGSIEEASSFSGPHEDASSSEPATDRFGASGAKICGDLRGALATLVTLDEVVKVQGYEVSESHGMSVFDCSTDTGWYVANGLIVHNSRDDDRVRETHRQLSGQTKKLDKPFTVDGMEIMRPGDPEAPPELVIRCRCHLAFSVNPT